MKRQVIAVAAVSAALLLAGCSGSDDPPATSSPGTRTPSSSSAPSATLSTSPSPTTSTSTATLPADLPAAAREHTRAGAEAFVEYFWKTVDAAWRRPDGSLIPALCLNTSRACQALQEEATALASKDHRYAGPIADWKSFTYSGLDGSMFRVDVVGEQNRVNIVDREGQVISTDARKPLHFLYSVDWRSGRWFIAEGRTVMSQ